MSECRVIYDKSNKIEFKYPYFKCNQPKRLVLIILIVAHLYRDDGNTLFPSREELLSEM